MKKLLILLVGIISFLGISKVNAYTLSATDFYDDFINDINQFNTQEVQTAYNTLLSTYSSRYSSEYPYYFFSDAGTRIVFCKDPLIFHARPLNDSVVFYTHSNRCNHITYSQGNYSNVYSSDASWELYPVFQYGFIFSSNSPLIFEFTENAQEAFNRIEIPSFSSQSLSIDPIVVTDGDYLPTFLDLYNGTYEHAPLINYQEINLNNYSYIALSLKNYSQTEAFSTNIYTKGQLCLTPVYDYGMKDKTEYYSGYQVQGCTSYYNDFNPVRTYITQQDLNHHAIYYVKAYDTTKENKIKVDLSVFDITFITSENADNPIVNINGRNYSTIPYDELLSTSTESEENGYISGESINVIDSLDSNSISNIFSNPLNTLKSVWGAIVSFLALITTFIALLPPTMQAFLYMAFSIAIILGIIKILL